MLERRYMATSHPTLNFLLPVYRLCPWILEFYSLALVNHFSAHGSDQERIKFCTALGHQVFGRLVVDRLYSIEMELSFGGFVSSLDIASIALITGTSWWHYRRQCCFISLTLCARPVAITRVADRPRLDSLCSPIHTSGWPLDFPWFHWLMSQKDTDIVRQYGGHNHSRGSTKVLQSLLSNSHNWIRPCHWGGHHHVYNRWRIEKMV